LLQAAPAAVPASTVLSVPLKDALAALRDRDKAMASTSIEGDAELAATLSYLVEHLRWDPEDDLAQIVGDERAVMAMRFFSQVSQNLAQTGSRFAAASREYVLHEQAMVVSKGDLDRFADDVRRLRDDCARLEKRVGVLSPSKGDT
jgi:ubiquinone biosynthesis protein UbiJ